MPYNAAYQPLVVVVAFSFVFYMFFSLFFFCLVIVTVRQCWSQDDSFTLLYQDNRCYRYLPHAYSPQERQPKALPLITPSKGRWHRKLKAHQISAIINRYLFELELVKQIQQNTFSSILAIPTQLLRFSSDQSLSTRRET